MRASEKCVCWDHFIGAKQMVNVEMLVLLKYLLLIRLNVFETLHTSDLHWTSTNLSGQDSCLNPNMLTGDLQSIWGGKL